METDQVEQFRQMRKSVLAFARVMFGLVPQPIREEFKEEYEKGLLLKDEEWREFVRTVSPRHYHPYREGVHLTWQQSLILIGVDKALKGECSLRLSIVSGHGIGKSMVLSLIILWFLFVHPQCQVACTSPGREQLYDVLWKELKKWIDKMPKDFASLYVWETTHVRMKENPEVWFARAKTASKENTEALAGVHADWVLIAVDEASGVDEPIFETMEGSLTSGNILVFLISNGTRANGYFFDTHHKDKSRWQNFEFSSLDSPRVDNKYIDAIVAKYGADSVQYAIRVLGKFPSEDLMDDGGYVPLLSEKDIHVAHDFGKLTRFSSTSIMGVDPSGEGDDKTSWVIRDNFKAKKVHEEAKSTAKSIAERTLTLMAEFNIQPRNVVVDSFGSGMDVGKEIAIATKGQYNITTVNVGEPCVKDTDKEQFINKRAEIYYKLKKWFAQGGEVIENENMKQELLGIKYKRAINGKIQIMSKVEMKKKFGLKSPNDADALSLTFLRNIVDVDQQNRARINEQREQDDFDPFEVI